MDYPNKKIDTTTTRKPKSSTVVNGEEGEVFMFPHSPSPIAVTAKDIHEAEEKFKAIISKEV